jgi:hypothetical protein
VKKPQLRNSSTVGRLQRQVVSGCQGSAETPSSPPPTRRPKHELMCLRHSLPTKRPINQYPLPASPLNNANLMAGLHAGDRIDTKPTEQGGGIESL